ncbi:MAG TPA: hypothetical protein VNG13_04125 [Mycobacteriales bacterium]|nr:hypothetical protein [Mycobacteriales bacterium]
MIIVTARRQKWGAFALAGVCSAICLAPWLARDAVAFHRFIPITDQSEPVLAGTYNDAARLDHRFPGAWRPENLVTTFQPLLANRRLDEAQLSQQLSSYAEAYMAHHPDYVALEVVRNSARILGIAPLFYTQSGFRSMGFISGRS